jgi:hypothetical protein
MDANKSTTDQDPEPQEKAAAASGNPLPDVQAAEDFDLLLDEFFAANPEKLPALPADFSRADIYSDHDKMPSGCNTASALIDKPQ